MGCHMALLKPSHRAQSPARKQGLQGTQRQNRTPHTAANPAPQPMLLSRSRHGLTQVCIYSRRCCTHISIFHGRMESHQWAQQLCRLSQLLLQCTRLQVC
jgi:hypothetical protein